MHTKTNRATIKQVASAAGVSTQTVSRVINNRPDVSPKTRKQVQKIIDSIGYQPSALARGLIRQRSYMLGVVTAGLKYIGPSRTLSGITSAAEDAGYTLVLKELHDFVGDNVASIFQKLVAYHVDGIIWAVPQVGGNRIWINQLSLDLDIPIVYLTMESKENVNVVSVNNFLGGQLAMRHLLEQGYRHIGHIAGPLDWWEASERKAAWSSVLKETGSEVSDKHWVEGNWSSASGAQAIEKLSRQYPEMDAVFVANDQMALAVMQFASQKGLHIPSDLGVVGFDNILEAAYFWPPLTTIQQDHYNVGIVAVQEVIKIIETSWQDDERTVQSKSVLLTPTLIVRRSSLRNEGGKGGGSGKYR